MLHRLELMLRKKEMAKTGIYTGEITDGVNHHRGLICLLRGFMIFLGTYGTLIGLLTAFKLPYNPVLVIPSFFLASMFVAFLYYNKIIFYLGYFFLLGGFTYGLVYLYMYANSGYQAIINEIYAAYSDYFKLLSVREGQEFIESREITVSVAIIFMGIFLAMMLNVTISGYMNVLETMLITFPIFEVAFFINRKPPLYCLIMVLSMYVFVGILQASRHQRMQVKGKHTHEYLRYSRKNKKYYFYQGNLKGNVITAIFAVAVAVLVGILAAVSYNTDTEYLRHNAVRQRAEEYVKIYIQTGWTGWMNRYENTGGMASGRLGGVGEVRPDFETDLSVTYAPYTFSTMYLKGFTGTMYGQNQFYALARKEPGEDMTYISSIPLYHDRDIKEFDSKYLTKLDAKGRMNIVNLDADPQYSYLPYFADPKAYDSFQRSPENSRDIKYGVDITYYPNTELFYNVPENYEAPDDDSYLFYVNNACTEVPEDLDEFLKKYVKDNNYFDTGFTSLDAKRNQAGYEDINAYRIAVARKIYSHYVNNFKYTMAPGATPYNKDVIEYFLDKQKRGYCAHFASAGVMLLREFGVPARYCEGYIITPSNLAENAIAVNEKYEDWYEGKNLLDEEGVVNIEINDSYAHAWVEIYLEGYGFVPFEMTPPSDDEEQLDTSAFSGLFAGLFNFRMDIADLPDPNSTPTESNLTKGVKSLMNLQFDFKRFALPLVIVVSVLALGLTCFYTIRAILRKKKLKVLYENGQFRDLVYINYEKFTSFIMSHPAMRTKEDHPLPKDVCTQLTRLLQNRTPDITEKSLKDLFTYIERTLYSDNQGTREEYDNFLVTLELLRKTLKSLK